MTARKFKRGGMAYYYGVGGQKIPLGSCPIKARHRWAELEAGRPIDDGKLLELPNLLKRSIPLAGTPGIYFLFANGQLMYVGRSINLWRRIEEHKRRSFDSYSFVPCQVADLTRLEARYIDKFKPPWNT